LTYYYEWQRSENGGATWQIISTPNQNSYTLGPSDVADLIRCQVYLTYTVNVVGVGGSDTSSALSNAVGPITQ
jgi:hypothetical protein